MVGGGVKGRAGRARKPGWGATRLGYARDNEKIGRSNRKIYQLQYHNTVRNCTRPGPGPVLFCTTRFVSGVGRRDVVMTRHFITRD
jgi:hypothetical protein